MSVKSSPASANVQQLREKVDALLSAESFFKGVNFKPEQSDVIIVTAPKCGTTWMQQIVHQLRTGGDMQFNDTNEIVPWLEGAHDLHLDLNAEQRQPPRSYYTHYWYNQCPKGAGKYIVLYREPCAVAYSHFTFFEGWFFERGDISLQEFVCDYWMPLVSPKNDQAKYASYFEHLVSWWPHRNDPNVLFLFYEDLKEDLDMAVRAVASFIGIENEENIKAAVRMSTFDFMKASGEKFQVNLTTKHRNKAVGVDNSGHVAHKVATGSTTKALEVMCEETKQAVQETWRNVVSKETGYGTYDELRKAFRNESPLRPGQNKL